MTQKLPYHEIPNNLGVIASVLQNILPLRPDCADDTTIGHDIWHMCERCWDIKPNERPSMQELAKELSDVRYLTRAEQSLMTFVAIFILFMIVGSTKSVSV